MTSLTLLSAHYFWKSHNTLKPTQTHTHTHSKSNSSPVLAPANPLFCLLHPHLLFSLLPHPPRPWQNVSKPLYVFSSIISPWDSYVKKMPYASPQEAAFPTAHITMTATYINLTGRWATDWATIVGQELEQETEWQPWRRLKGIPQRGCALTVMYKHSICCEAGSVHWCWNEDVRLNKERD